MTAFAHPWGFRGGKHRDDHKFLPGVIWRCLLQVWMLPGPNSPSSVSVGRSAHLSPRTIRTHFLIIDGMWATIRDTASSCRGVFSTPRAAICVCVSAVRWAQCQSFPALSSRWEMLLREWSSVFLERWLGSVNSPGVLMNILRLFPGDAVVSRDLCSPLLMVYSQLNIVIHRGGFQRSLDVGSIT